MIKWSQTREQMRVSFEALVANGKMVKDGECYAMLGYSPNGPAGIDLRRLPARFSITDYGHHNIEAD